MDDGLTDDTWSGLPLMLTVEEAARLLRIGRSLAYAQTTLYFATGGTEGIPTLRLGGVLRIPSAALRELATTGRVVQLIVAPPTPSERTPAAASTTRPRRRSRTADQLALLDRG